jgi:hypothetical protein
LEWPFVPIGNDCLGYGEKTIPTVIHDPGSLRDPDGAVFRVDKRFFRAVSPETASRFEAPGMRELLEGLVADGLLMPYRRVTETELRDLRGWASSSDVVYEHPQIPFISYPYEWPFSQLKTAALTTLELLRRCLKAGFVLKDASAYNVQLFEGRSVHIDILSIEPYKPGMPWIAYGQFCRHFLNPLLVTASAGVDFHPFLRARLDGLESRETMRLLPYTAFLKPSALTHVVLQGLAGMWTEKVGQPEDFLRECREIFSVATVDRLAVKLTNVIAKLEWHPQPTVWAGYEHSDDCNPKEALVKRTFTMDAISLVRPSLIWDLGSNIGSCSLTAVGPGRTVVAIDRDHVCVELLWRRASGAVIPLVMDLANPSPAQGFAGRERMSLTSRGPAGLAIVMALLHHLVLGEGLRLDSVIDWLSELCRYAVLEFVPPEDPKAMALIERRGTPNGPYSRSSFESVLTAKGMIHKIHPLRGSARVLYLWEARVHSFVSQEFHDLP